jgi:hypothetical protein
MALQPVRKFIIRFNDKIFATLWFELFLFSVLIGIASHSLAVTVLMLLGLSWLICRAKGTVYTVVAMSLLWGYIAASIGYSFGGWVWVAVLGSIFLIKGVRIHWRKLGLSWVDLNFGVTNTVDLRNNWY